MTEHRAGSIDGVSLYDYSDDEILARAAAIQNKGAKKTRPFHPRPVLPSFSGRKTFHVAKGNFQLDGGVVFGTLRRWEEVTVAPSDFPLTKWDCDWKNPFNPESENPEQDEAIHRFDKAIAEGVIMEGHAPRHERPWLYGSPTWEAANTAEARRIREMPEGFEKDEAEKERERYYGKSMSWSLEAMDDFHRARSDERIAELRERGLLKGKP